MLLVFREESKLIWFFIAKYLSRSDYKDFLFAKEVELSLVEILVSLTDSSGATVREWRIWIIDFVTVNT